MKKSYKILFLLPSVLSVMVADRLTAQTFKTLHTFDKSEGAPFGTLLLSDSTVYGTTHLMVFRVNSDGTGFKTVHNFSSAMDNTSGTFAGLVLSSNTLYGTTGDGGGPECHGGVFAIDADGGGLRNLFSFSSGDNTIGPSLIIRGKTLYGTSAQYGIAGVVFALSTDGAGFRILHYFTGGIDGGLPFGGLVLSDNTLYGTAAHGGSWSNGTVFSVRTDGTGFTNLYSFSERHTNTNTDGATPHADLILSDNILYGTTTEGGSSGNGTVFSIRTDGGGFKILHALTWEGDGASPRSGLVLSGNVLYGTAAVGGSGNSGTAFALSTDGSGFRILHSFTGGSDGAYPFSGLILSDNTLYGTTRGGGSFKSGTVFSISLPPR